MAEDTAPAGAAADRGGLVAGYELLRAAALVGNPEGWRLGRGLLASRGKATWMAAWTALVPVDAGTTATNPPAFTLPAPSPQHPSPSSVPRAGQIVAVIAQMALAHA